MFWDYGLLSILRWDSHYSVIELSSVHISQEITKRSRNVQKRDAAGKKTAEFANQRLKSETKK